MAYQRVAHGDPGNDGSATDAAVVVNAIEVGLERLEALQFNVVAYGAVGDNSHDDTAAFNAAIAALNATATGGQLRIPAAPTAYKITSALTTITKPVHILGDGMGWYAQGDVSPSRIIFAAGVGGFSLGTTTHFSTVEGINLVSLSAGAENFDGLTIKGNKTTVRNVAVEGFGRYGFNLDTSSTGNINISRIDSCRAYANRSHGYYITGTESQAVTFTGCDATANLGWGFYTGSSNNNTHVGLHASLNTSGAVYDNGSSNLYLNPYIESGTGSNVTFDTGNVYTTWIAGGYSNPTITWSGGSAATAQVMKQGAFYDHFIVSGLGGIGYGFHSGAWNSGWLSIRDDTNGVEILDCAPNGGAINVRVPFTMQAKPLAHAVNALSYGAGVHTIDALLGDVIQISLTASTGALSLVNGTAGQVIHLSILQTGAGSFTVGTWPTNFRWVANTAPTLTTTTGHQDNFTFCFDGTNWVEQSRAMNTTTA